MGSSAAASRCARSRSQAAGLVLTRSWSSRRRWDTRSGCRRRESSPTGGGRRAVGTPGSAAASASGSCNTAGKFLALSACWTPPRPSPPAAATACSSCPECHSPTRPATWWRNLGSRSSAPWSTRSNQPRRTRRAPRSTRTRNKSARWSRSSPARSLVPDSALHKWTASARPLPSSLPFPSPSPSSFQRHVSRWDWSAGRRRRKRNRRLKWNRVAAALTHLLLSRSVLVFFSVKI